MSREETLRRQLRARAWDALAAVPDDLGAAVSESVEHAGWEVTVTVRRAGGAPAAPAADGVLSLGPVQRFLPGAFLTDLEHAVVALLLGPPPVRLPGPRLRDGLEQRLRDAVSEGVLKGLLARMSAVGILDSSRRAPQGYAVTAGYREFLAWAARAGALPAGAQVA